MKENQDKYACPYSEGVACGPFDERGRKVHKNCEECGWNPKVATARMAKYYREHGIMTITNSAESE